MFKDYDHVIIAVSNLQEGIKTYEKLGLKLDRTAESQALGVKQAFFKLGTSGHAIELVEPLGPETPVGRAMARRGEGVYGVACPVPDIAQAVKDLQASGVQLIGADQKPLGAVFIHPRNTHGVLFQIFEKK
ncbi:MAG: VOC family protein [Chloroflexi bacterium]|nr:VOC family protein [Chloroflexota bacterium]